MWTEADRSTYRQAGDRLPSDLSDPRMGAPGAVDSASQAWRAPAQDRHALGDERDLLSSSTGSSRISASVQAADGLQILPRFPAAGRVGGDLGGTARGAARTAAAGGEPQRRRHRQLLAQVRRKGGCAKVKHGLVGLAVVLQVGVADSLADGLFGGAFDLLDRTGNSVFVHDCSLLHIAKTRDGLGSACSHSDARRKVRGQAASETTHSTGPLTS